MITSNSEATSIDFAMHQDWREQELLIREVLCETRGKPVPEYNRLSGLGNVDNINSDLCDATEICGFDTYTIRRDFPILNRKINGKDLIWFDNSATTQKPQQVIERIKHFYENENSNVHRGAHTLAAKATDAYEGARKKVQEFIGAKSQDEIVFTRGATESINLVAESYARSLLQTGDKVLVTELEHHANIVPWQKICDVTGAELVVAPIDDMGQIIISEFAEIISDGVKVVAVTHVSNVLGIITPVKEITQLAHSVGAVVLVDGAQAVPHIPVDVVDIDCDFFVFSGHKLYGPTGIGVLYGKKELLKSMPPYQAGGNMIEDVTFWQSRYQKPPRRFEAGTGNIAGAVGLGAALDYVSHIGVDVISKYENCLMEYAMAKVMEIPAVEVLAGSRLKGKSGIMPIKSRPLWVKSGILPERAAVISFNVKGYSDEEVGRLMDSHGIALRAGHHCALPVLRRFGKESSVRASFAFYNTFEEIDEWIRILSDVL